jgi:hypothetical protein
MYKDDWNGIAGNCDTKIDLGTDDNETNEWIAKMLGNRKVKSRNESYNSGKQGGGSTSIQNGKAELMSLAQIRLMPSDECLVLVKNEMPYYGKKYELTKHPNYAYAHKHEGEFVIPVAKEAEEGRRNNVPLRLRKKAPAAAEAAIEAPKAAPAASIEDKAAASKAKAASLKKEAPAKSPKNGVQKRDEDRRKAGNDARKEKAAEAKAELKRFEEDMESITSDEATIAEALGITPQTTKSDLKEIVESMFTANELTDEAINYAMTD